MKTKELITPERQTKSTTSQIHRAGGREGGVRRISGSPLSRVSLIWQGSHGANKALAREELLT